MFAEICGWISSIGFILCFIPQIVRTWRLKSVDDISMWVYILLFIAYGFSTIYGVNLNEWPLICKDLIGLSLSWLMIVMFYMYRNPQKDYVRKIVAEFLHDVRRKLK